MDKSKVYFSKDISSSNLVRLYDEERNLGIGACKIGGGDFILEKSWDKSDKSISST